MDDGNEINISPDSKFTIDTYDYDVASNKKKVLMILLKGKVRATTREENMYADKAKDGVANSFLIKTMSAVAGVRGTDFLVSLDNETQKTEVTTFRGNVEVGLPGEGSTIRNSVQVAAGQRTQVLRGGNAPDKPKPVPAAALLKLNKESRSESRSESPKSEAASKVVKTREAERLDQADDHREERRRTRRR